jgi:hypothetical protein
VFQTVTLKVREKLSKCDENNMNVTDIAMIAVEVAIIVILVVVRKTKVANLQKTPSMKKKRAVLLLILQIYSLFFFI